MARWLDLDQDGDLDLYVVNYCAAAQADTVFTATESQVAGLENAAYRNDGQPDLHSADVAQARTPIATAYGEIPTKTGLSIALVPWPAAPALLGGSKAHTGMAVLDLDNDRDMDLVLSAEGAPPVALLNDRLGRFHEAEIKGAAAVGEVSGLLTTAFDSDDRTDVVAVSSSGPAVAWRNITAATPDELTRIKFETWPINAARWRSAQAIDLDLDGWADLLGLPAWTAHPGDPELPFWCSTKASDLLRKLFPPGSKVRAWKR